jgi:hypothetical protein
VYDAKGSNDLRRLCRCIAAEGLVAMMADTTIEDAWGEVESMLRTACPTKVADVKYSPGATHVLERTRALALAAFEAGVSIGPGQFLRYYEERKSIAGLGR